MNIKRILFSALITSLLLSMIGFGIARVAPHRFVSDRYPKLERTYTIGGAVAGFLIGSILQAVRQLKEESDREESQSDR